MANRPIRSSDGPRPARPAPSDQVLLGVDTGGTFTDFVMVHGGVARTLKVPSTPADPAQAILAGIHELGLDEALAEGRLRIVHGSTVATNALLEGRLARTLYVGNRGFEDVLVLGRQARRELYALQPALEQDLVPDDLRVGTGGRIAIDGTVLEPLTDVDLDELARFADACGAEAVAVNLLYSYLDARAERRIAERLGHGRFVSCSSDVLPEYREYERGVATWLNAALGPVVSGYLTRLAAATRGNRLAVMMSSGGTIDATHAASHAVTLLLSGPAGGAVAAARLAAARLGATRGASRDAAPQRLLTFDMGGTSTDVALVDGAVALTNEGAIAGLPVAIPMADIHTIGAGGGSIARIDDGGLLQVGPRSAGAEPGPACYGRGGTSATVTDANVVLGRLPTNGFLGGRATLDVDAARRAIAPLADALGTTIEGAAAGIVAVANENMAGALRLISVERGYDPRDFALCCFGGAGGMHVCDLAESLGMAEVLLPRAGSVLSALGMLQAAPGRQGARAVHRPLSEAAAAIEGIVAELAQTARAELVADGVDAAQCRAWSSIDLRYLGQSYYLNLALADAAPIRHGLDTLEARFHAAHEARYGHRVAAAVELVNVRVRVDGPAPLGDLPPLFEETLDVARLPGTVAEPGTFAEPGVVADVTVMPPGGVPVHSRGRLGQDDGATPVAGPAIITEPYTCTWVAEGWEAVVEADGTLVLRNTRSTGSAD
jgi:N-methylhydantoinase A